MAFREPPDKQESFQGWSPGSVVTGPWKQQGSACSGSLQLVWNWNLWFFGALIGNPQNHLCSLAFRRTGTERGSSLGCPCTGSVLESISCGMSWFIPSHLTFPSDFFAAPAVCLGAGLEAAQPPSPTLLPGWSCFLHPPQQRRCSGNLELLMCCSGNGKAKCQEGSKQIFTN